MKLNPWQLLIALVVLFAAIILAHLFVPTAAAAVVSMAVAAFAALFVNRKDDGDPPAGSPNLTILKGGVAALVLCGCAAVHTVAKPFSYGGELAACEASSKTWDDYVPCCLDVAARYGRDPNFCFPDEPKDGGK